MTLGDHLCCEVRHKRLVFSPKQERFLFWTIREVETYFPKLLVLSYSR
jgi:hypothetical protein